MNPALLARRNKLLAQLSILSEARAQRFDPAKSSPTKPGHMPPPGVSMTRDFGATRPPDPDDNLRDWFLWQMARDRTEPELQATLLEAEIRLEKRLRRPPADLTAGTMNKSASVDTAARDTRIAKDYVGLSPLDVSTIESLRAGRCSPANVRRVRLQADRDPETGERLPEERKLRSEGERRKRVFEMREKGFGLRDIALKFGVSHTTVANWIERWER